MLNTHVVRGMAFRGSAVAILKLRKRMSKTLREENPFKATM